MLLSRGQMIPKYIVVDHFFSDSVLSSELTTQMVAAISAATLQFLSHFFSFVRHTKI